MKIISRKAAKKQGLRFYNTGKECLKGHLSNRYTNSSACVQCAREKNASKYEALKASKCKKI